MGTPVDSSGAVAEAAWRGLAERLGALPERLDVAGFPDDPAARAAAVRHLGRHVALALEAELDHADPRHPTLHRYEQPWSQWGAPNPDNVYERCAIDPAATYVLRGRTAGVHEALFSLVEGDMHLGEVGVFAEVALSELDADAAGDLELVIGPEGTPGAHLVTDQGARMLLVRQYLNDWATDPVASLSIERVDTAGIPAGPPSPDAVAAALDRAARWVEESITYWAAYAGASRDVLEHNTFTAPNTPPGGAPSIAYGGGCWELSPGQALVIDHELPEARYWNWSVHHLHTFDSGAFHERSTSVNGAQAHVDGDARVRIVVAAEDPGTPNWLDTEGQALGMAVYRYVGAVTKPQPAARVVSLGEVAGVLPDDHPVITPARRRELLAARRVAAQRRWS